MNPRPHPTVLLIDDDPDIRELMSYAFAEEEVDLVTCRTPEEGFRILSSRTVDCLLLDIHFAHTPECFGLLDALRVLPNGRDLPVLVTSTMREAEVESHARLVGARKFIPKPFCLDEVVSEVRALLH